jgi:hypothetical protein
MKAKRGYTGNGVTLVFAGEPSDVNVGTWEESIGF